MIVKPADISRELSVILMYLISLIARPSLSVILYSGYMYPARGGVLARWGAEILSR